MKKLLLNNFAYLLWVNSLYAVLSSRDCLTIMDERSVARLAVAWWAANTGIV